MATQNLVNDYAVAFLIRPLIFQGLCAPKSSDFLRLQLSMRPVPGAIASDFFYRSRLRFLSPFKNRQRLQVISAIEHPFGFMLAKSKENPPKSNGFSHCRAPEVVNNWKTYVHKAVGFFIQKFSRDKDSGSRAGC